jgi:hypothetical protein
VPEQERVASVPAAQQASLQVVQAVLGQERVASVPAAQQASLQVVQAVSGQERVASVPAAQQASLQVVQAVPGQERVASVPAAQQASLQVVQAVPGQERQDVPEPVAGDLAVRSAARWAGHSPAPVAGRQQGEQESPERSVCLPGLAASLQKRPDARD